MTAVQLLIDGSQTKATTFEPMDKPEGGLDLAHPYNLKALRQIDWQTISALRQRQPPPGVVDLFQAAICNPSSCPIGWSECRRRDWEYCHYYDLLRAVEAIRHGNPLRKGETNSVKEGDDGRDR